MQASQEGFSINKYPLFMMGIFSHAKICDQQLSKRKFHAAKPMGGTAQHAVKVP